MHREQSHHGAQKATKIKQCWAWSAVAVALVVCVHPALAGTLLYVDDDAPAGGTGASWPAAHRFLQDAFTAARQPGSTITEIRVAQGTYRPDQDERHPAGTLNEAATFDLVDDVIVLGGCAGLGAPDPDTRDIVAYETVLSGHIFGECYALNQNWLNIDHVVTSSGNTTSAFRLISTDCHGLLTIQQPLTPATQKRRNPQR